MALRVRLQRGGVLLRGRALCLDAEIDLTRHRVGQFDRLPRVGADLVDQFLRRSQGAKIPIVGAKSNPGTVSAIVGMFLANPERFSEFATSSFTRPSFA